MASTNVSTGSVDRTPTALKLQEFYHRQKGIVWVIRIRYWVEGEIQDTFGTAFTLRSDGLVATSAHVFPKATYTLHARRLEEKEFHFSAEVAYGKPKWDITLLRINEVKDSQCGSFANDGSLIMGQTLVHIGHPDNFVGSLLVGKAAYQCVNDVELPKGSKTCKDYTPIALAIPPKYRKMGDVWNASLFTRTPPTQSSHAKNMHPDVPIIQMYGLVCGPGCSGGPVFNLEGEIVGMVAMAASGYEIAIHVSMLCETLRIMEQDIGNEEGKRKEVADSSFQGGDPKKRKAIPATIKGKGKLT